MSHNWYIELELEFDPNPVHDLTIINARIDEKLRFWTRGFIDFHNGPKFREYHERQHEIRAAMSDPKERERLITEACEITYAPVDALIKMVALKGHITQADVQNIAKHQKIEVDVVNRRIAILGVHVSEQKLPATPRIILGIDLGTTYSRVAYLDESGRPIVVHNSEGECATPSVVNFASLDEVMVGQIAKDSAVIEPESTVFYAKTLLGRSDFAVNCNGRDISPEEVVAYILTELANDASNAIGRDIKDVVLAYPAYYGSPQKLALQNVAQIAGLNLQGTINEPSAVALYYYRDKEHKPKTVMIYDLGGASFDVAIVNINDNEMRVVSCNGVHELGTIDWAEGLVRYMYDKFVEQIGNDTALDGHDIQVLRQKAKDTMKRLSHISKADVIVSVAGITARIEVLRDIFEDITSHLLSRTLEITDYAINDARQKGYIIDEVILIGGGSRMPQVRKGLSARYGIPVKICGRPLEAVVIGAAMYAQDIRDAAVTS